MANDGETPERDGAGTAPAEEKEDEDLGGKMSFIEHLEELRYRIVVSLLTVGGVFLVIYSTPLIDTISAFFMKPMRDVVSKYGTFIFTAPAEGFLFNLKLAAVAAIFISSPMIFYQLWAFVAPGLYLRERKYVGPFIIFSTLFFAGGAAFFYFLVFPIAANFFAAFANPDWIEFNPKLSETFSFVIMLAFAFGLVFELPLVTFILARLGLINVGFLNKNRKYAILIILIVAAIVTPPDVASQLLLAFPMWILFELSVLVTWIFGPEKEEAEQD